ncbi:hypothetical protein [Aestuariivirga sp.]|uniref:hypothetical protein n=1 Tax=Aestuariivirga sp. TaxID=2650926 RepID=UPI003015965E
MTFLATENRSGLGSALGKLIDAVEHENSALREQRIISHAGFTDRKNHALRELMAVQRRDGQLGAAEATQPLLKDLSDALQENARLLKLHIAAVGEVSDIIVGCLKDTESDGTYSRGLAQRRW